MGKLSIDFAELVDLHINETHVPLASSSARSSHDFEAEEDTTPFPHLLPEIDVSISVCSRGKNDLKRCLLWEIVSLVNGLRGR